MCPGRSAGTVGGRRWYEEWQAQGKGPRLDEGELIARSKRGDHGAYEELVRRYQEAAFRIACLIVGEAAEAEDAAQEAFVRAYSHLGRFRSGAPFRPWLLTIVANEARNRRLARSRRTALAIRAGGAALRGEASPSAEAVAVERERRSHLLAAVNGLREEERLAVACRYFLDLSEAESAAVIGCPRGTVKSRLSRALGHLRAALEPGAVAGSRETSDRGEGADG